MVNGMVDSTIPFTTIYGRGEWRVGEEAFAGEEIVRKETEKSVISRTSDTNFLSLSFRGAGLSSRPRLSSFFR